MPRTTARSPEIPCAYALPWRVLSRDGPHPVLLNAGPSDLDFVRVFHNDSDGETRTALWGRVPPGDEIEVCLCTADLDDVVTSLAWFRREDGLEYLWRFVL